MKAVRIIKWVSRHISYDPNKSGMLLSTEKMCMQTFCTRQAVCDGYATLTTAWMQKAGLEAKHISGLANIIYPKRDGKTNIRHGWVVIKLNGRWWAVDPTWLSVSRVKFDGTNSKNCLFIPLKYSLYNRFPDSKEWRTSNPNLDKWAFKKSPFIGFTFWYLEPKVFPKLFTKGGKQYLQLPRLPSGKKYKYWGTDASDKHVSTQLFPIAFKDAKKLVISLEKINPDFIYLNVAIAWGRPGDFPHPGRRMLMFRVKD